MTDAPFEQPSGSGATTAVGPPSGTTPASSGGGGSSETGGAVSTIAEQTASRGGDLAHEAAGEVRSVVGSATDQAKSLAGTARHHLGQEADGATNRAADAIATAAGDLTALAKGEGSPDSPAADVVRQIGERAEQVADRLRDGGYQGVVDDVSRWARAHPGTFLLAAAGAGFAIGRIFRTVDTGAVLDATKEAVQPGESDGSGARGSMGAAAIGSTSGATDEPLLAMDPHVLAGGRPASGSPREDLGAMATGAGSFPSAGGAAGGTAPSPAPMPDPAIDLTADPAWQEPGAATAGDRASEGRS